MALPDSVPRFDMKLPFWAILVGAMTTGGAYYGQREATSVALAEIRGDMTAVKATMTRIETDRYSGADARRDFAWRGQLPDEATLNTTYNVKQIYDQIDL